jgi:hypothetical protein
MTSAASASCLSRARRLTRNASRLALPTCLLLTTLGALAFPPAPPHVLYGTVRDEMGTPFALSNARIILEATNGVTLTADLANDPEPGVNYRLIVPVDSGIAPDLYKPTALKPQVGFKLRVQVGNTVYLPIEMLGSFRNLGRPAEKTRMDLTLGVDADGDGLPDAWEQLMIAMIGGGLNLATLTPNGIAPNGLSWYANYIAGTFPWDPEDGFRLTPSATAAGPRLDFQVISGRTYTLEGSTNLAAWQPVLFRMAGAAPGSPVESSYRATDYRLLQVDPALPPGPPASAWFFRAQVR